MASSPKENHDDGEIPNTQPPPKVVLALPAANHDMNQDSGCRPPIVKVYTRRSKSLKSSDSAAGPLPPPAPAPAVDEEEEKKKVVVAPGIPEPGDGWVRLSFSGRRPKQFVGLKCKVFWPEDYEWYQGQVVSYNRKTKRHQVDYDDGDVEILALRNERIHFLLPPKI